MKKKQTLTLYWKCQLIGWSLAALYWQYEGLTGGNYVFYFGLIQFVTDIVLYIGLTHVYRSFAIKWHWQELALRPMVIRIIPAIFIMGVAYLLFTVLKIYLLRICFLPDDAQNLLVFFKSSGMKIFIAGIRLMSIWLLAYHLYQYAQREIRLIKLNATLAMNARDARLNPHFLFNALNTIKALVIEKPAVARRAIDLLAEILRNGLYKNNSDLITIRSELDQVKDYLELEGLRMEERLATVIEVDEKLLQQLIPRFSLQILIENAIKHGVARQKAGGLIALKILNKNDMIAISVSNPGKLIDTSSTGGIGLKSLRERIALEYQGRARLEMIDGFNGSVEVILLIPLG